MWFPYKKSPKSVNAANKLGFVNSQQNPNLLSHFLWERSPFFYGFLVWFCLCLVWLVFSLEFCGVLFVCFQMGKQTGFLLNYKDCLEFHWILRIISLTTESLYQPVMALYTLNIDMSEGLLAPFNSHQTPAWRCTEFFQEQCYRGTLGLALLLSVR